MIETLPKANQQFRIGPDLEWCNVDHDDVICIDEVDAASVSVEFSNLSSGEVELCWTFMTPSDKQFWDNVVCDKHFVRVE